MIEKIKELLTIINNPVIYLVILLAILLIISIIILLNYQKGQWLLWIGISSIINALFLIPTKFFVPFITRKILVILEKENLINVINPFIKTIFNNIFKYSLGLLIVGFILIIIYLIQKKHSKI